MKNIFICSSIIASLVTIIFMITTMQYEQDATALFLIALGLFVIVFGAIFIPLSVSHAIVSNDCKELLQKYHKKNIRIVYSDIASYSMTKGCLILTESKLIFESSCYNSRVYELEVELNDIKDVQKYTLFGIPSGIKIIYSNKKIVFGVDNIDFWINALKKQCNIIHRSDVQLEEKC